MYFQIVEDAQPNVFVFNQDIVISEIAYNPPGLGGSPGVPPTFEVIPLVAMEDSWRYNSNDVDLTSSWATEDHPSIGDWTTARGPIGFESGALPVPLSTVLSNYFASWC